MVLFSLLAGVSMFRDEGEGGLAEALTDAPPDVQVVEIIEKEWKLTPTNVAVGPENNITLKAGTVRFVLTNEGTKIHDFQVSREDFDKKSKRVGVGKSRIFEVTLEAGEYDFFCPISGHRRKGMEGTLTVLP